MKHKKHNKKQETSQQRQTVTLGLVPAPDLAKDLADNIQEELSDLLCSYVDPQIRWDVDTTMDPLTGATVYSTEILKETKRRKEELGWDYAICITDLPLLYGKAKQLMIAEASASHGVALISLPSLGAAPMKHRVREAILQLTNEMYHGSSKTARDQEQQRLQALPDEVKESMNKIGSRQLMRRRLSEWLSPIKRITQPADEKQVDVRFIVNSRLSGGIRLLSGMVRANRPWKIFPEFKRVLAAAFATGTYGLVFPTLWQLSGVYDLPRFFILMAAANVSMVIWIILVHGLWEKIKHAEFPYLVKLYNAATVVTLTLSVFMYYVVLFILFTLAVILFVPASLLEEQTGHSVSIISYISLAWTAASIGTIVGALGAALEREETVRNATYGYRQRRRYEVIEKELETQNE